MKPVKPVMRVPRSDLADVKQEASARIFLKPWKERRPGVEDESLLAFAVRRDALADLSKAGSLYDELYDKTYYRKESKMSKERNLIITPRTSYKNPVCIRVSDDEKHWLDEVVAESSLSVSEVMRSLISIARANGLALGAQQPGS